ncbi:MAG: hypothetical protein KDA79_23725 [Planctomycetaceae bacterium]|nr:hypothetical protein [Planctomycetaceae bacterium]
MLNPSGVSLEVCRHPLSPAPRAEWPPRWRHRAGVTGQLLRLCLLGTLAMAATGCGSIEDPAAADVARWVFSKGGTVTLEGKEIAISSEEKLPESGTALIKVDLHETDITNADLSQLADLKHLRSLVLHSTAVTDAGLPALAPLTTLEELELSYTAVTDECLNALHGMKQLKRLFLRGTVVTPEAARQFEESHPGATVYLN